MTQTPHLGLNLFDGSDPVLVSAINENTQKLDALPQIVTGSYIGTGENGEEHPVTLTFDKPPKLVIVGGYDHYNILVQGCGNAMNHRLTSDQSSVVSVRWQGNTVSFWASAVSAMCNEPGRTERYVAFL